MKHFLSSFLIVISSFCLAQNSNQFFEQANTLYNNEKYTEAIDQYESILETGVHSAELYFNLANANYKLNNIAPSIYYYEKALQLKPNDKTIKNNLAFAQNMTIDAITVVPEVGFSKLFKTMVNKASIDAWAKIAISTVVLFVVLFLVYYFSYHTTRKRMAFVFSIFSLLAVLFCVTMAFQKQRLEKNNNPAIIFEQEVRVKTDPKKTSEEVFRLHEGTKVQVLEIYEDWYKIQLSDNVTGWIPSENAKLLNVF